MIMKICCCHSSFSQAGTCKKSIPDVPVFSVTFQHHGQQAATVFPADFPVLYRHFHYFLGSLGAVRMDLYGADRYVPFLKRNFHLKILWKNFRDLYTPVKICRKFISENRRRQLLLILRINLNTVFKYSLRFQKGRLFKKHKICKFSRCDRSSVIKMHTLTGCIGGTVDCLFYRKSHLHRFLHHCIQRSLLIQNVCHRIIRYKRAIFVKLVLTDIFQDFGLQHFILDFKKHSVFNPLLHFLQSVFRMITVNTQIQEFCKIQIQK